MSSERQSALGVHHLPNGRLAGETLRDLAGVGSLVASLSADPASDSVEQTLEWLRHTLDVEASELFLREPRGQDMLLAHFRGPFRGSFSQITRFQPGEGFPGLVLSHGAAIRTADLPADKRYLRSRVKSDGFRSYVCVPLRGPDGVIGTLNVAARRSDLDLDRAQQILTWASVPLAGVLEAGSLRARLDTLAGVAGEQSQGGLDDLLMNVLHRMMRIGNATAGGLTLLRRGPGGTLIQVSEGDLREPLCAEIRREDNLRCPAFAGEHGISLHGPRSSWPPRCRHMTAESGMLQCIPLIADGQPVGLVRLQYADDLSPPTKHLVVLLAVANQIAGVVSRARDTSPVANRTEDVPSVQPAPTREEGDGNGWRAPALTVERSPGADRDANPPLLDIRCFGSFELYRRGKLLPADAIQRRGAIALLKMLIVNEGRAVPRDVLAEALWPEADPSVTANRLYVLIHALRRAIEPSLRRHKRHWTFICNDGDRYYFSPEAPYRSDIRDFRRAVEVGEQRERSGNLRGAADSYGAALDLYRGDLFEEEPYAEWCWAERENLRETALDVATKTAGLYDQWGAPGQSIMFYQRALRMDPLREQIHRRLIEALLAAGRRSEALRQYSICKELLRRELGIEPMPETQRLHRLASKDPS